MKRTIKLVKGSRQATSKTSVRALCHEALLVSPDAVPLESAHLSDQRRLALVLEATCLLAHLAHGGWCLREGWQQARVTPEGCLRVGPAAPGRDTLMPQARLARLLRRLFGHSEIAGRGRARRVLRYLSERWRQTLMPIDLDRAVAAVFDAAPFLWQPGFSAARRALVAAHGEGEHAELWVVGPGASRRRWLASVSSFEALAVLAASPRAMSLWVGPAQAGHDPRALAERGRFGLAAQIWQQRPLKRAADLEIYARTLFALGRFERALDALRGLRAPTARLLRARCLAELGERGAAEAAVARLAKAALDTAVLVPLADLAVRLATLAGHDTARADWVARALRAARGPWCARARLVQALAAYDSGDPGAMDAPLAALAEDRRRPDIAWRWHHARALQAAARRDGPGCVRHARRALALERRTLPRSTAGRLWSTLVVGFGLCDELASAEKAVRHSLRLFADCDGPIGSTLAWHNLAEVRVRRGRFEGVEAIIETVLCHNRRAGNVRGRVLTLGLRVRTALGRGRLAEALEVYDDALRELEGKGVDLARLHVLAARALAWLGRRSDALAALDRASHLALSELEPEERPALLALAGRGDEADRIAQGTPWAALWRALAAGKPASAVAWQALDALEPYRAARVILDAELLRPGSAPAERVRHAVEVLRDCGARAHAERLEARGLGPWAVLEDFLAQAVNDPCAALRMSLTRIGQTGTRVVSRAPAAASDLESDTHASPATNVLVAGEGGAEHMSVPVAGGVLDASAEAVTPPLRVLLGVFARVWHPPQEMAALAAPSGASGMIGTSPALLEAIDRLERLALLALPVLVLGESGTGKELAARHVHRQSPRASGPFIAVNCAAMSEGLIRSDLFGHVRGAFTGADRERKGVFEAACSGTVFLDEIGDLPLSVQGMLLRVLQESEIRRVGETHSRRVDARVVAATHRDLAVMVENGSFRRDLFFRLKAATVRLPPLRERAGDIHVLADRFLARLGSQRLSLAARRRLETHSWQGNIRELGNVLEVAASLAGGDCIEVEHLDLPESGAQPALTLDYHQAVETYRRQLLCEALEASRGNRAEAARRLGLSRQALSYLVKKLDLYEFVVRPQG